MLISYFSGETGEGLSIPLFDLFPFSDNVLITKRAQKIAEDFIGNDVLMLTVAAFLRP